MQDSVTGDCSTEIKIVLQSPVTEPKYHSQQRSAGIVKT